MALIQNLVARLTLDSTQFDGASRRSAQSMYGMQRQSLALQQTVAGLAGVYFAGRGLIRAVENVTAAYLDQEDADRALATSLKLTGDSAETLLPKFKAFATEMQKQTVYGDEAIEQQMAYGHQLGITTEELQRATVAAIGLAAKTNKDLPQAMRVIALAAQGESAELKRMGIAVDESLSPMDRYNELIRQGTEAFRLAQEQAKTTRGELTQLKNDWGELKEMMGKGIQPVIHLAVTGLRGGIAAVQENAELKRQMAEAQAEYDRRYPAEGQELPWYLKALGTPGPAPSPVAGMSLGEPLKGHANPEAYQDILSGIQQREREFAEASAQVSQRISASQKQVLEHAGSAKTADKDAAAYERQSDARLKAEADVYREIGAMRDQSFAAEEALLLKQYNAYYDAGVDRVALDKWWAAEDEKLYRQVYQTPVEEARKAAIQQDQIVRQMYEDMEDYGGGYLAAQERLIDAQVEEWRQAGVDEVKLAQWAADQKVKAAEDAAEREKAIRRRKILQGEDFGAGAGEALGQLNEDTALGRLGYDVTIEGLNGVAEAFANAKIKGQDFGDQMRSLGQDLAAEMLKWAVLKTMLAGIGGAMSLGGAVGSWVSGSAAASVGHAGGSIGTGTFPVRHESAALWSGAPRLHEGLRPDEFRFIGQRGEKITSKAGVAAENKLMGEMVGLLRQIAQKDLTTNVAVVQSEDAIINALGSRRGRRKIAEVQAEGR